MVNRTLHKNPFAAIALGLAMLLSATAIVAQTTSFTYQGKLTDGGAPANGNYDFQFTLWDSLSGATQIGSTQSVSNTAVSNGVFTVNLDFGATNFPGADRFLEISARATGATSFTLLTPRQQVTSSPYAVRSANASSANTLSVSCTGCITDSQIGNVAASKVTGTIPVSAVPAGSGSYVQNTTAKQASTNFNISGDGTVGGTLSGGVVNSTTQYNIGGTRVLSADAGGFNLSIGPSTGQTNNDYGNTFVGFFVGAANTSGVANTFLGSQAGRSNTTGFNNDFFGDLTGYYNTTGVDNSFFGSSAGYNNSTGGGNTFVGASAAGSNNTTGSFNTVLGDNANVGSANLNHATAIGAGSSVLSSNTVALGRSGGFDVVVVYGLGGAGSTQLCRNSRNEISSCSSSLRYKTNIAPFSSGLNLIRQLRPISFDWKTDGSRDLGFGAEDVARINPLFVTYNAKGEVEGVKYDRLSVAFVNAFKEQQAQIQQQQELIKAQQARLQKQQTLFLRQQRELESLKELVCRSHRRATLCK